jgi:hypothetical protein
MSEINNNQNLSFLVKRVLLDCLTETTFHALPKISKKNNHLVMKIIWLCSLIACTIYCTINCVQQFQEYYSYPTSTMISTIEELPTQFPAISFCNVKLLNRSNTKTMDYINNNPSISQAGHFLLRFAYANDQNLKVKDRKELGYKIENMLVFQSPNYWCNFNNDFCYPNDFTYFYNPAYGNCYSFNIGFDNNGSKVDIKNTSTSDKMYGLMVALFLGDPSVDTVKEDSDGIIMSIHNQSTAPFTQGIPILVSSEAETDIVISRNFISKLPPPYGSCLDD